MSIHMQEVFDRVALHLLQQNERSAKKYDQDACMYRGPNGLKCAVGFLIPDELYHPNMEGKLVSTPMVVAALHEVGVLGGKDDYDMMNLLYNLQGIHDKYPPHRWFDELTRLAGRYSLTMPKLASQCRPMLHEERYTSSYMNSLKEEARQYDEIKQSYFKERPITAREVPSDGQVEWFVV